MSNIQPTFDRIVNTTRVIDPMHDAVIAGTAGIALHLGRDGWPQSTLGPQDVDFIAEQHTIIAMHARAQRDPLVLESALNRRVNEYQIPVGQAKLEVAMADHGLFLDVNAFTQIDDNAYDISASTAAEESVIVSGERTLPLDTLLTWKIMAGRSKDLAKGEVLVGAAEHQDLLPSAAVRTLRAAIVLQRNLIAQRRHTEQLARA